MAVERVKVTSYGGGKVAHAPVVRAGKWIFGTGLRAVDGSGVLDKSVSRPSNPLMPPPKPEREARYIFGQLRESLVAAGSDLSRIVRLDQYYPNWRSVDPYHVARKEALGAVVAPSTSILVNRVLNLDAAMDIQVVATTSDSGLSAVPVTPARVGAPKESGYSPCLRVGDFVFVAGQLARDETGNIAPQAQVPPGQLWKGTRIKLETDYLIRQRLVPALQAANSDLDLVLKAQVYLSHVEDLPAFLQVWRKAFGGKVPPTTIVPVRHPGFGTEDATLEVNVVAASAEARGRIRDVECSVDLICDGMLPARSLDGLLFVAGLMAIDSNGLVDSARLEPSAPFLQSACGSQMADILMKADRIFRAAGTELSNVVRSLHFHTSLSGALDAYREWERIIGDTGLPFSAIEVDERPFVPGAELIVDLWGYIPGR